MAASLKSYTLLVIEDDEMLCEVLQVTFELAGATVFTAHSGEVGLKLFHEQRPDLVVLDVRLPSMTGWEVLKFIRIVNDTPVVMLTTMREDKDRIRGLNAGADAYLAKPFSAEVLVAQVEAVLRRARSNGVAYDYADGYLEINVRQQLVHVQGVNCELTGKEFKLLAYLLQNAGNTCSYEQILTHIWGLESRDNIENVHVHASNLRRKVELNPRDPVYILTSRGIGYRFQPQ